MIFVFLLARFITTEHLMEQRQLEAKEYTYSYGTQQDKKGF